MKANLSTPWCLDSLYAMRWVNNFHSQQLLIYTNKSVSHWYTAAKCLQINKLNIGILVYYSSWRIQFGMHRGWYKIMLLCTINNQISCFTRFIYIQFLSCEQESAHSLIMRHQYGKAHTHAHHATSTDTHNYLAFLTQPNDTCLSNQR